MTANIIEALRGLDTCTVSDALDALGLPGVVPRLRSQSVRRRIVGRAITVQLAPVNAEPTRRHLGAAAVDAADSGSVIIVANAGRIDTAAWGGILSTGAASRGVQGVIVDGAVRDLDEAIELELPIYAITPTTITARGRYVEQSWNTPIAIDQVTVRPSDYVLADSSGVVFVGQENVTEIVDTAVRIAQRERRMTERAAAGESMVDVMGAQYERLLEEKRNNNG